MPKLSIDRVPDNIGTVNEREGLISWACYEVSQQSPEIKEMCADLAAILPGIGEIAAARILASIGLALQTE